ncbi:YkgJ family cysteine cluster protein [Hydrocarboniclastica marina]|uniref:YkgJ family cysteine cluster protein n=1 Tax=Hydrocarboniclastica marina TaxID=2259620 RepID=UPI00268A6923
MPASDPGLRSQRADQSLKLHPIDEVSPSVVSCGTCEACCCRLEVILEDDRGIPPTYTALDAWGGLVMRRLEDGWCAALDRKTFRCSIYSRRPQNCRDFALGSHECLEERAQMSNPNNAPGSSDGPL